MEVEVVRWRALMRRREMKGRVRDLQDLIAARNHHRKNTQNFTQRNR
jgi:hypothetical protein